MEENGEEEEEEEGEEGERKDRMLRKRVSREGSDRIIARGLPHIAQKIMNDKNPYNAYVLSVNINSSLHLQLNRYKLTIANCSLHTTGAAVFPSWILACILLSISLRRL